MKHTARLSLALIAVLALIAAPGCKPKPVVDEPSEAIERPEPARPAPTPTPPPVREVEDDFPTETQPIEQPRLSIREINDSGVLQTVYFDFDRSELTGISQAVLRKNADWLKNNREYNVAVEGHCDARGTIEYNLALGQRRANAVREFLYGQGVALSRIRTVSYGEERPASQGNSETAWSRNRRAEFVVEE